jgi:hypothetical protein
LQRIAESDSDEDDAEDVEEGDASVDPVADQDQ